MMNVIELTQKLIQLSTPSPDSGEGVQFIQNILEQFGAKTIRLDKETNGRKTANLYAKIGDSPRVLAFAGHTDVVPPGHGWIYPPYEARIVNDCLYGRGIVDMKGAIAAFICATEKSLDLLKDFSIAFLITGDEEDMDDQGTFHIVNFLKERHEKIESCLIGEPSNPTYVGEMIKVGRRGSLNFTMSLQGTQGHVAYPDIAHNPIPEMLNLLNRLNGHVFDQGYDFFDPTHLELTSIDVGNAVTNIIPAVITAKGNVRFNPNYTHASLRAKMKEIVGESCEIHFAGAGEAFLSGNRDLAHKIQKSSLAVLKKEPILSTTGGTSDGRFIIDICDNLCEFGLISQTAHKVDENVALDDLNALEKIYTHLLSIF